MSYKPDGYTDLSPYLIVEDAQTVLDFAAAAFGAPPKRVVRRDDGSIMHAEALIGDSILMIGESYNGPPAHLHLYMSDPDAAMAKALDAGDTLVQEMAEAGDGDRRGGVQSADGTTWWLSKQIDS